MAKQKAFTIAMDWLMKVTTTNNRGGIRCTLTTYLENLDYADDISLLSSRQRDMQEKTDRLTETAQKLGLKVNTSKTKLMKINDKSIDPVTINNSDIDEVNEFRSEEEKMEMAGARALNATRCTAQMGNGKEVVPRSKGAWRRLLPDLAKNHGDRDDGTRTDLGHHHQTGRKPTAVALSCGSRMCHLRQGEDWVSE